MTTTDPALRTSATPAPAGHPSAPEPPEGSKAAGAELEALQEAVLSLEWEVSERHLQAFEGQLRALRTRFGGDRHVEAVAQMALEVGRYLGAAGEGAVPLGVRFPAAVLETLQLLLGQPGPPLGERTAAVEHLLHSYRGLRAEARARTGATRPSAPPGASAQAADPGSPACGPGAEPAAPKPNAPAAGRETPAPTGPPAVVPTEPRTDLADELAAVRRDIEALVRRVRELEAGLAGRTAADPGPVYVTRVGGEPLAVPVELLAASFPLTPRRARRLRRRGYAILRDFRRPFSSLARGLCGPLATASATVLARARFALGPGEGKAGSPGGAVLLSDGVRHRLLLVDEPLDRTLRPRGGLPLVTVQNFEAAPGPG